MGVPPLGSGHEVMWQQVVGQDLILKYNTSNSGLLVSISTLSLTCLKKPSSDSLKESNNFLDHVEDSEKINLETKWLDFDVYT